MKGFIAFCLIGFICWTLYTPYDTLPKNGLQNPNNFTIVSESNQTPMDIVILIEGSKYAPVTLEKKERIIFFLNSLQQDTKITNLRVGLITHW